MSDLTDRLRAIASKATGGPWEIQWEHVSAWETSYGAYDVPVGLGPLRCDLLNEWEPGDLAHVATFDPALVAAMLDVIDAAEGAWGTFPDSTQGREAHTELAGALVTFMEVAG